MIKHNVIQYKVNKSVAPKDVVETIELLIGKHSAAFRNCLFDVKVTLYEFECDGVVHSNRNKNAINTILKRYPHLTPFYKCNASGVGKVATEEVSVGNISFDDFSSVGEIEYGIIREIASGVPRPYSVNSLTLIYDGISFGAANACTDRIRKCDTNDAFPKGNYIWYERTAYGDEKHSYIDLAADDKNIEPMRRLFFELAQTLSGKYDGTEII